VPRDTIKPVGKGVRKIDVVENKENVTIGSSQTEGAEDTGRKVTTRGSEKIHQSKKTAEK